MAVAALAILYAVISLVLCLALPGQRQQFEYMVIGTGATGVTMLALFLGLIFKWRT